MIYTIGSSHAGAGFDQLTGISCHVVGMGGPFLLYSFVKNGLNLKEYKINATTEDVIIFCYGETDCRCHIHKYAHDYRNNIEQLTDNYLHRVKSYDNILPCIYNVPPPCRGGDIKGTHAYPILGSDEDRKIYTLYLNQKLKEQCEKHNVLFFDVYDKYCADDGFMNKKLSNQVHITDPTYIEQFINSNAVLSKARS